MLFNVMLYAKKLKAYLMPLWYFGSDGESVSERGVEQVLTPSAVVPARDPGGKL